jgi:3-oxoacyl-[acyl-carrier protein] reductase
VSLHPDDKSYSRKALVTGVSRGIGLAIAEKLLDLGFTVTGTHSRSPIPEKIAAHPGFRALKADFSDFTSVDAALKSHLSGDDAPGILVNNAGIADAAGLMVSDREWMDHAARTMMINFTVPAMLAKWALPVWTKRQGGILINIASRAAYRGDTGDYAAYAASKAALTAFTKSFAREYSGNRITAVTIAPGFVETDMAYDSIRLYGKDHVMKDLAVPELTQPSDVAEVVAAVASGKMLHITGTTIHVNGGSYLI